MQSTPHFQYCSRQEILATFPKLLSKVKEKLIEVEIRQAGSKEEEKEVTGQPGGRKSISLVLGKLAIPILNHCSGKAVSSAMKSEVNDKIEVWVLVVRCSIAIECNSEGPEYHSQLIQ